MDTICIPLEEVIQWRDGMRWSFDLCGQSKKHLIYLDDVHVESLSQTGLSQSRILRRSWTLSELLANGPVSTMFFDSEWRLIGTREDLSDKLSKAMRIRPEHLHDHRKACVAAKLSWGAHLHAATSESRVYALLDLIGVDLDFRSGEGEAAALRRLQEAVIENQVDESILAWQTHSQYDGRYMGLLAPSLDCFRGCKDFEIQRGDQRLRLSRDIDESLLGAILKVPLEDPSRIQTPSLERFKTGHITLRCFDREDGSPDACISFNVRQPEDTANSWQRQGSLVLQRWTPIERSWIPKFKKPAKTESLFFAQEPITGGDSRSTAD